MQKITIYENMQTGEILTDHNTAMDQYRAGNEIKVYYQHNKNNFIIWQH